jgi:2,4-dienoyl-CoA reductase (NADPH2)
MAHWGVDVHLNTRLTAAAAIQQRPDLLVTASGARPARIHVPGIDKPHVKDAWDVLAEKVWDIGDHVVVVGGNATGCETALFVAEMGVPDPETFTFLMVHSAEDRDFAAQLLHTPGRNVTVIDMVPRLADNAGRTARWSLIKGLKLMGVALRPRTTLVEIRDDSVLVKTEDGEATLPADTVILAVGAVAVSDLTREMEGSGIPVIAIGDAKAPRKITEAVKEGFETALAI